MPADTSNDFDFIPFMVYSFSQMVAYFFPVFVVFRMNLKAYAMHSVLANCNTVLLFSAYFASREEMMMISFGY